jgi:hypothetical protein
MVYRCLLKLEAVGRSVTAGLQARFIELNTYVAQDAQSRENQGDLK